MAVQLLLGGGDLVLGALAVNGIERLSGGDGVSGGHKDLPHRAPGGQGDGGVLLRLGVAAARGYLRIRCFVSIIQSTDRRIGRVKLLACYSFQSSGYADTD